MTIKEFLIDIEDASGKPGNFPRDIHFSLDDSSKTLRVESVKSEKDDFRRFEPWALALLVEAEQECSIKIRDISFAINSQTDKWFNLNLESFRRRVSFLAINNDAIRFKILLNGKEIALDNKDTLFHRPDNEVIHDDVALRSENTPGKLEKDFQDFLSGKGLVSKTNDRLAILGEDFYQVKGKGFGVLREFPTGVFDGKVSDITRILPTESVDIITQNKWGNLAVIELKVDDSKLEVISQILDYGLYFSCYRDLILKMPAMSKILDFEAIKHEDIFCYVVNNRFHPRFNSILKYYSVKTRNYGFCLKKVVLGETIEI